eukprot:15393_1
MVYCDLCNVHFKVGLNLPTLVCTLSILLVIGSFGYIGYKGYQSTVDQCGPLPLYILDKAGFHKGLYVEADITKCFDTHKLQTDEKDEDKLRHTGVCSIRCDPENGRPQFDAESETHVDAVCDGSWKLKAKCVEFCKIENGMLNGLLKANQIPKLHDFDRYKDTATLRGMKYLPTGYEYPLQCADGFESDGQRGLGTVPVKCVLGIDGKPNYLEMMNKCVSGCGSLTPSVVEGGKDKEVLKTLEPFYNSQMHNDCKKAQTWSKSYQCPVKCCTDCELVPIKNINTERIFVGPTGHMFRAISGVSDGVPIADIDGDNMNAHCPLNEDGDQAVDRKWDVHGVCRPTQYHICVEIDEFKCSPDNPSDESWVSMFEGLPRVSHALASGLDSGIFAKAHMLTGTKLQKCIDAKCLAKVISERTNLLDADNYPSIRLNGVFLDDYNFFFPFLVRTKHEQGVPATGIPVKCQRFDRNSLLDEPVCVVFVKTGMTGSKTNKPRKIKLVTRLQLCSAIMRFNPKFEILETRHISRENLPDEATVGCDQDELDEKQLDQDEFKGHRLDEKQLDVTKLLYRIHDAEDAKKYNNDNCLRWNFDNKRYHEAADLWKNTRDKTYLYNGESFPKALVNHAKKSDDNIKHPLDIQVCAYDMTKDAKNRRITHKGKKHPFTFRTTDRNYPSKLNDSAEVTWLIARINEVWDQDGQ